MLTSISGGSILGSTPIKTSLSIWRFLVSKPPISLDEQDKDKRNQSQKFFFRRPEMGFMLATLLETFSTRWSVQLHLKTSECSHADLRPQVNGMRSEKEILGSMECHALLTVSGSHRGRPKLERGSRCTRDKRHFFL